MDRGRDRLARVAAGFTGPGSGGIAGRPSKTPIPFQLGLASYTLRNFDLDRALAITRRVQLDRICLKSMHLPLDSKPAEIAAAVEKVKRAGLVLYGGGVISMKSEREIVQALEYARAAGMRLITAAPVPEILPVLDEQVKKYDVVVAIHNHGPGDRYFPTPQSVYNAVKSLDHRIGLCIDIGHTVRIGADLLGSIRNFGVRLFDLHIKDVTAATPEGRGTPVGRGIIDFPGLAARSSRSSSREWLPSSTRNSRTIPSRVSRNPSGFSGEFSRRSENKSCPGGRGTISGPGKRDLADDNCWTSSSRDPRGHSASRPPRPGSRCIPRIFRVDQCSCSLRRGKGGIGAPAILVRVRTCGTIAPHRLDPLPRRTDAGRHASPGSTPR